MDKIPICERIKYYRKLLNITKKELGRDRISVNMISLLESGKRKLTVPTASILIDNFNEIAAEKGVLLNLSIKHLLLSEKEYAYASCMEKLQDLAYDEFKEQEYLGVLEVAEKYGVSEIIIAVCYDLGQHYYEEGAFKKAILYLKKALESAEEQCGHIHLPKLYNRLGACFYETKAFERALECLEKAKRLYKKNGLQEAKLYGKILINLSLCEIYFKSYYEALQQVEELFSIEGLEETEITKAKLLQGNLYSMIGKDEKAAEVYEKLLRIFPENYLVHHNLGIIYDKLDKAEEGLETLNQSIQLQLQNLSEDTTISLLELGHMCKRRSQFKGGIICFENAIKNAKNFHQLERQAQSYEALYEIHKAMEKPKEFEHYIPKITTLINTLGVSDGAKHRLTRILFQYVMETKQYGLGETIIQDMKEGKRIEEETI